LEDVVSEPILLLNTTILTTPGRYEARVITPEEARSYLVGDGMTYPFFISAIGHQATADVLSEVLGVPVPVNRTAHMQMPGQRAIALRLTGRRPEGQVLDIHQIKALGFDLWMITRLPEKTES
jgi:hypothetical protein